MIRAYNLLTIDSMGSEHIWLTSTRKIYLQKIFHNRVKKIILDLYLRFRYNRDSRINELHSRLEIINPELAVHSWFEKFAYVLQFTSKHFPELFITIDEGFADFDRAYVNEIQVIEEEKEKGFDPMYLVVDKFDLGEVVKEVLSEIKFMELNKIRVRRSVSMETSDLKKKIMKLHGNVYEERCCNGIIQE